MYRWVPERGILEPLPPWSSADLTPSPSPSHLTSLPLPSRSYTLTNSQSVLHPHPFPANLTSSQMTPARQQPDTRRGDGWAGRRRGEVAALWPHYALLHVGAGQLHDGCWLLYTLELPPQLNHEPGEPRCRVPCYRFTHMRALNSLYCFSGLLLVNEWAREVVILELTVCHVMVGSGKGYNLVYHPYDF